MRRDYFGRLVQDGYWLRITGRDIPPTTALAATPEAAVDACFKHLATNGRAPTYPRATYLDWLARDRFVLFSGHRLSTTGERPYVIDCEIQRLPYVEPVPDDAPVAESASAAPDAAL